MFTSLIKFVFALSYCATIATCCCRGHSVLCRRSVRTAPSTLRSRRTSLLIPSYPSSYSSSSTPPPRYGWFLLYVYLLSKAYKVLPICLYTNDISSVIIHDLTMNCIMRVVMCRSHAIACVNQFIISKTQALMTNIDLFLEVSHTETNVS